jgi:hypothetical protein
MTADTDRHNCDSRTRTRTRGEANRQNSAKSTGPKDTTSTRFNAVRHGLLAEGITELDHPETFPEFCAKIMVELKPVGEIETFLVRRIALGMVRCDRAALLEAEFITAQINPPITEASDNDLDRLFAPVNGQAVVVDPGLPASISSEAADTLANILARYETALENRLCRCLNQLERLQRLRQGEKIPAPASADIAVHG